MSYFYKSRSTNLESIYQSVSVPTKNSRSCQAVARPAPAGRWRRWFTTWLLPTFSVFFFVYLQYSIVVVLQVPPFVGTACFCSLPQTSTEKCEMFRAYERNRYLVGYRLRHPTIYRAPRTMSLQLYFYFMFQTKMMQAEIMIVTIFL